MEEPFSQCAPDAGQQGDEGTTTMKPEGNLPWIKD
jgi:hypothetical protein